MLVFPIVAMNPVVGYYQQEHDEKIN